MPIIPYCLNIHPGESLQELRTAIETYSVAVKAHLAPDVPYPLGLRISGAAAEELHTPETTEKFRNMLAAKGLYTACVNGFPYGAFHDTAVKAAVYEPDWSTTERLAYTTELVAAMGRLIPPGQTGNISTVPLGYALKPVNTSKHKRQLYVQNLALIAQILVRLQEECNVKIVLALEPEPDCLLEDIASTINWFENELLHTGAHWLKEHGKHTIERAETLLRQHIGICLDTCHFAVAFEEPLTAIQRFESAGIRIARIQLSAAISTIISEESLESLRAFFDPVYLHQTKINLPPRRVLAMPDLTEETLDAARAHLGRELRTHFHVPLFFEGTNTIRSTNHQLTPEFFSHVQRQNYPLEIETYTFNVLPPPLRAATVVENLIKEHQWVVERLSGANTIAQTKCEIATESSSAD